MKTKLLLIIPAVLAASPISAADSVDAPSLPVANQLPPAVKRTLDASARGEPVKQITLRTVDGRTVYEVELERKNAPNPHLRIAADGQLLRDTTPLGPTGMPLTNPDYGATDVAATLPRLKLEELPRAAQETIRRESAGREIAAITSDTVDGHAAYAVQWRESGRNPIVYIGEDGTVLRPAEKPPALGLGTMFSDTPPAVQETLRREIREGEIVKIDRESPRGKPAGYRVEAKDARGVFQIRVSDDGRVLENTRGTERPPNRG